MEIITKRPPNYTDIVAVFPGASRMGVIFAYAPNIYAPGGSVPPALVAHEKVHIARQNYIGVEVWWEKYLKDPHFRYEEELLAHRAEYQFMLGEFPSRQVRRQTLKIIAKKLSAPLYGSMISVARAMEDLQS